MKQIQTPLQRILRLETFYEKRGCNSERVNVIKRKLLKIKFENKKL